MKHISRILLFLLSLLPLGYFYIPELSFTTKLCIISGVCILIVFTQSFVTRIFQPFERIKLGIETIRDGDFTVFLNKSGSHEANGLIDVYNEMILTLQDKRIEVQQLQNYFEHIVNEIPFAVLILSADLKLKYANRSAEKMLRFSLAKLRDRHIQQIKHSIIYKIEKNVFKDNEIIQTNGQKCKINQSKFIKDGEFFSVITLTELTESLDSYELDSWKKVVRVISHEINNSISPIISINQSLSDYLHEIESVDEDYLEGIESVNYRLSRLSKFVSDYSQLAKLPDAKRTNCEVDSFFLNIIKLMKEQTPALSYSNTANIAYLFIDDHLFEQAIINIIKNAIDACEDTTHPKVSIEIIKEGHFPQICIRDNGMGISEEALENVFVPYYTTKPSGSVIGLSLVKEILNKHHFHYYIESELGKGTAFYISVR